VAKELSKEQLQRLARLGAGARLEELEAERRAILRAFPGLAGQSKAREAEAPGAAPVPPKKGGRRRKKMSAAQRKAASERMRNIWAERRKTPEA
jgi:hypothetical protein